MYAEDARLGSIEAFGASTAEELFAYSGQLNQCRQVLGELTYAYAGGRVVISYAVTLLARYSSAPDRCHYPTPKRLRKFLRRAIDWGTLH
jgi:hypothetical protein